VKSLKASLCLQSLDERALPDATPTVTPAPVTLESIEAVIYDGPTPVPTSTGSTTSSISVEDMAPNNPRVQQMLRDIQYIESLKADAIRQLDALKSEYSRQLDRVQYLVDKLKALTTLRGLVNDADLKARIDGQIMAYKDMLDRETAILDQLKARIDSLQNNIRGYDNMIRDLKEMIIQQLQQDGQPASADLDDYLASLTDTDESVFVIDTTSEGDDVYFADLDLGDPADHVVVQPG